MSKLEIDRLTARDKTRLERFDKDKEHTAVNHKKTVELISADFDKFASQNSKAVNNYRKLVGERQKDPKYQFTVNESGVWALVGEKINKRDQALHEEENHYRNKIRTINEDQSKWLKEKLKEQKKKESGKALYDTSSGSEPGDIVDLGAEKLEIVEDQELEREEIELLEEQEVDSELDLEKEKLADEARYINEQILALGELHATYITARNSFVNGSYDYYILDREKTKVDKLRKLYEHRTATRERIIQEERFSLDTSPDTDLSDGGYSDIEDFKEEREYLRQHITKHKKRQPKLDREEFEPDQIRLREEEVRRQRLVEEEEREKQQREIAAELQRLEEEDNQPELDQRVGNPRRNNMNQLKWSVQSVSKFHGDTGQNANPHMFEFNDFLKAARIEAIGEGAEDTRDATQIINDFVTTLKGKARLWFDVNIPEAERTTVAHWKVIKNAFKDHFNPLGSTREQRVCAWKDMRWDPTTESIDDFSYKYKELGLSLGLNDDNIYDNFKACIPGQYFVFVYNAANMADAIANLKKCIAAGPMIGTNGGITQTSTSKVDDKLKFMGITEEPDIFHQIHESINEKLVPVHETMSETKEMVDQMYKMAMGNNGGNNGGSRFNNQPNRYNGGNGFPKQFQNLGRGRGQGQNQGQRGNNGYFSNNNFRQNNGGNNSGIKEVQCTYCNRWRHTIANCGFLKTDLRKKGFRIAVNSMNPNNTYRENYNPNRGGFQNRNNFSRPGQGRGRGRPDQINCIHEDEGNDVEEEMTEDELFICYLSEFQEATGLEIEHETEELNN